MNQQSKVLLVIITLLAILIQYPKPKLDLEYYTELASTHVSSISENEYNPTPLNGVNIVITGATAGLGYGLAKTLHSLGGTIIPIGRSTTKLSNLKDELDLMNQNMNNSTRIKSRVIPFLADFSDLNDIAKAAKAIKSKVKRVDFLVNNAGVAYLDFITERKSKQGHDLAFGVNYLSHFLLTEKLLPLLKKSKLEMGPRIIQVSSSSHLMVDGTKLLPSDNSPPSTSQSSSSYWHNLRAYPYSKLAQIYHARSLTRKLHIDNNTSSSGGSQPIKIISVCPTWVASEIAKESPFNNFMIRSFGFDPSGFGIVSILHAMFHPEAQAYLTDGNISNNNSKSSKNLSDFVTNTLVANNMNVFMYCFIFQSRWAETLGIRALVGWINVSLLLFPQKFVPSVKFRHSSQESYDIEKQDALFEWSMDAIAPWL